MSQHMVVRSTVIGRTVKSPKLPGTKLTIWHCVSRSLPDNEQMTYRDSLVPSPILVGHLFFIPHTTKMQGV